MNNHKLSVVSATRKLIEQKQIEMGCIVKLWHLCPLALYLKLAARPPRGTSGGGVIRPTALPISMLVCKKK